MTQTIQDAAPADQKQDVTDLLRAAIARGEFTPNQRLVEVDLAGKFRTNRANVRTALAVLEQEGLIIREPNRGARVRLLTGREAVEIAEARCALEGMVARRAAMNATADDKAMLASILRRMTEAYDGGDLLEVSRINAELHHEIERIGGNMTVSKLLSGLKSQLVRVQFRGILLPGRAEQSMREHREVVEAICAGDPDDAERAMRNHLSSVLEALKRTIEITRGTFD